MCTMSTQSGSSLSRPTALLQSTLKGSHPWSVVTSQLLDLLRLYSNGLSLAIALDHFASIQPSSSTPASLHVAKVVQVAHNPSLWHLSTENDLQVAHFPHSTIDFEVNPGVTVSIAMNIHQSSFQDAFCADAMQVAFHALNHSSRNNSASSTTFDPADLNFDADEQSAETPSQSGLKLPSAVSFPTTAVLFHLETVPIAKLNLQFDIQQYTLQKVWNDRTLTPDAVFAHVVHVDIASCSLRLQDSPCMNTSQPSVKFQLDHSREPLIHSFHPGNQILLRFPKVTPTGNSFDLCSTDKTLCLYSKGNENADSINSSHSGPAHPQEPPIKKTRMDNNLSSDSGHVGLEELRSLSEPQLQPPVVAHARIVHIPVLYEDQHNQWVFDFGYLKVKVQVCDLDVSSYIKGDEIIFRGLRVNFKGHSVQQHSISSAEWIAQDVCNLSTMTAILFAPFIRNLVDGVEIKRRLEKGKCSTCHIYVRVNSVTLSKDCQNLCLMVSDVKDDTHVSVGPSWAVDMKESIYKSVFRITKSSIFRTMTSKLLETATENFRDDVWAMTLTCDRSTWTSPQVRACASAVFTKSGPD